MGLDVTNVSPFPFAVSISDLPVAPLVENPPESVRVTAVIEIPDRDTLRVHRVHWQLRPAAFTFTVAVLFGLGSPCAAPLIRQDDFGIREPGSDKRIQPIAEKFRKVGEAPANDLFNLPPRPLPSVSPPFRHPAAASVSFLSRWPLVFRENCFSCWIRRMISAFVNWPCKTA